MSDQRTVCREENRQQLATALKAGAKIAKAELLPVENGTVVTLADGSYFEIEDRYHPIPTGLATGPAYVMPNKFFEEHRLKKDLDFIELYGAKGKTPPEPDVKFENLRELMKQFSKLPRPEPDAISESGVGDAVSRSTVGILDQLKLAEPIAVPASLEPGEQAVDFRQPENVRRWWRMRPEGEEVDPLITAAVDQKKFRDFLDTVTVGSDGKPHIVPKYSLEAEAKVQEIQQELVALKKSRDKHAYHASEIPKGKTGYFSKIWEEVHEAKDAYDQGNTVMLLVELADTLGAIECFLEKNIPGVKLEDIVRQAQATNAVFRAGGRPDRDPPTDPGV